IRLAASCAWGQTWFYLSRKGFFNVFGDFCPVVLLNVLGGVETLAFTEDGRDAGGDAFGARVYQVAVYALVDEVAGSVVRVIRGDDGNAIGVGFDDDNAETFAYRGQHEYLGGFHDPVEFVVVFDE